VPRTYRSTLRLPKSAPGARSSGRLTLVQRIIFSRPEL
jgi:hypothetical protein